MSTYRLPRYLTTEQGPRYRFAPAIERLADEFRPKLVGEDRTEFINRILNVCIEEAVAEQVKRDAAQIAEPLEPVTDLLPWCAVHQRRYDCHCPGCQVFCPQCDWRIVRAAQS